MCVAYRLSLRVVWLFFPQCPSRPPQPRWLPLRDSSCERRQQCPLPRRPLRCAHPTRSSSSTSPRPAARRSRRGACITASPGADAGSRRADPVGQRTPASLAPTRGAAQLPHPTGRMGGGAHAALRRRRPHLLRRPPPFHARRLRVYLASQVDAVLAHLHAAWSKCLSLQCPSSAPAPFQGASGGSGRLETPTARGQATGRPATALGARASRLKAAHSTAFDHAGTADSLNEFIERVFVSGIDPHGDGDEPAEGGGAAGGAESGAGPPGVGVGPPGPHVPPGLGARLAALRSAGELATMEAPPSELDCHALPQWVYLDGLLPGRPACQVS